MEERKSIKIALVGPESTGKTTLCEQLATHFNTVFVPEFARTYFEREDISNYTIEQVADIYKNQLLHENNLNAKNKSFVFCDTALISGKIWCEIVFKKTPDFIEDNLAKQHYNLYLLCDVDIAWVKDEQRKNEKDRMQIFEMHQQLLKQLNANYKIVSGFNENRLQNAIKLVNEFLKPETNT